ncbi:MAG TPA: phosphoglycerate mutase family protein [Steroidobacteraceae bacterium]|nr:phosphoglycerate mutase family protein [Steroidobacteraceae bacterium]
MEKELKRLKRRPFMFPLLLPIVVMAVVVAAGLWVWDMRATTVVVIVRHAEVDADGNADPNLSLLGRERAARLARMLSDVGVKEGTSVNRGVDAIYASELRRTQQTAAPLAESLSLPINVLAAAGWSELGDRLKSEQQGKVVLVVGHSNTVPTLVEALAAEKVTIGETEFDHLYVVFVPRLSRTRLLHLRF